MGWLSRRFGKRRGVYAIVNSRDGKVYVGSSTDLKKRAHDHLYLLRSDQHPNPHLQYAFNKYGEAAFEIQILQEVACEEELLPAERAKMSAAHKGRTLSEQPRAKLSQALTGRPMSVETRAKIRATRKANPLTDEARARIVEARRVLTPGQVQEIRRRLASGEAIRSIAEAYGVNYYTIWNIQKRKTWSHLLEED